MTLAVVASEYADEQTILAVLALCIIAGALIGRWWSLLLPIALIAAVYGAAQFEWYYEPTRGARKCVTPS